MRVFALSDLHLDFPENLEALRQLSPHPEDWLILAGDIGHRAHFLTAALECLNERFFRLVWVPGNHDLWTVPGEEESLRGEEKYQRLVEICRGHGVLTPEDPYETVHNGATAYTLAPLFLLYDYSFRPSHVSQGDAVKWAVEAEILCADEHYLDPHPYPSVSAWCRLRCDETERRLAEVPPEQRLVLINHFPLREDLVRIRIPRFRIWCGTKRTESWHRRFNVAVVVSGHLHVRSTDVIDEVRFEEVSLGYPRQWRRHQKIDQLLRQIVPEREA